MVAPKILLVDDDPITTESLKSRLEEKSYQVVTASNGVEALERAHLEKPDIIVLDIILPKMDGYQVFRALRESDNKQYSQIPIIVITARESLVDDKAQAANSAEDYLVKPFEADDLLIRIEKLLGHK